MYRYESCIDVMALIGGRLFNNKQNVNKSQNLDESTIIFAACSLLIADQASLLAYSVDEQMSVSVS